MPGRGLPPKDPSRRARTNKDPHPVSPLRPGPPAKQPPLPRCIDWHPVTRAWWKTWRDAPQAEHFTTTDWAFAYSTAVIHHNFWSKQAWTLAAELRLRESKMGATIEDRLRLRMQAADADEKDAKRTEPTASSRSRRGGTLHSLEAADPDAVETA
jgi:hypothetical protein